MNKDRLINSFLEMIKIYSPSKKEGKYAKYLVEELNKIGVEIYLDNGYKVYGGDAPTIIGKLKGNVEGKGVTLVAHMDVVEPCDNINYVVENGIIKTDGTTTLGGDDKGGIASIIETLKVIKESNISHEDIFVVFTPGEEAGMLGAKSIDWTLVPKNMKPAKDMIVVDNAGRAGIIAHTAPAKYGFSIKVKGRKAHAGIEPEKGINAILLAGKIISKLKVGRIDGLTTSNLCKIESNFPSNVVSDCCIFEGEVRSHSEEKILSVLNEYKESCEEVIKEYGGEYNINFECSYPTLKPTDNLKFAREFAKVYEEIGIKSELKIIGGGSDSNIFAKEGYNSIIIGVGMYNVHTVDERLEIEDLYKTTEAIIKYISK